MRVVSQCCVITSINRRLAKFINTKFMSTKVFNVTIYNVIIYNVIIYFITLNNVSAVVAITTIYGLTSINNDKLYL